MPSETLFEQAQSGGPFGLDLKRPENRLPEWWVIGGVLAIALTIGVAAGKANKRTKR